MGCFGVGVDPHHRKTSPCVSSEAAPVGYFRSLLGTYASTEAWLKTLGIDMRHIHTSGHASPKDLKRFAEALAPRALIPIHSFATEKYSELFSNVVYRQDGDWWEV